MTIDEMTIDQMKKQVSAFEAEAEAEAKAQADEETRQEAEAGMAKWGDTHEARTGHSISSSGSDYAPPEEDGTVIIVPKNFDKIIEVSQSSKGVWVYTQNKEEDPFDAEDGEGGIKGWGVTHQEAWSHAFTENE